MCGIVGLHLRDPELYPQLGRLLDDMLGGVAERGPDSAGIAVYGDRDRCPEGYAAVSVLGPGRPRRPTDAAAARAGPAGASSRPGARRHHGDRRARRRPTPSPPPCGRRPRGARRRHRPRPRRLQGRRATRATSPRLRPRRGRPAGRASPTPGWPPSRRSPPSGCHPFSVGPDQCLVHNGSFSNHATIRRELERAGRRFDSENDTEVGARFVAARLAEGEDLEKALRALARDVRRLLHAAGHQRRRASPWSATRSPASPRSSPRPTRWVAMASEFRALADLPGIDEARIFEPEPGRVYAWQR